MTLVSNTFQGDNGINLVAASSGGPSGDLYQIVNPSNTDAVEYSSAQTNPITNTQSTGKFDASLNLTDSIGEVRYVRTEAIRGAQQVVVKFTGLPSSTCVLMQIRGTIQNGDLRVNATGIIHLSLADGTYALSGGTPIDMSPTSPWYVIDFWVEEGTTTTNGRAKFQVRALSDLSTVLYGSDSGATRNTGIQGTDTITNWRIGKFTNAATMPLFYVAQHRADDGAADYIADPTEISTGGGEETGTGTVYRHTFEGWTDNQTITTAGTGSGATFGEVPATNGSSVSASTAAAVHGSLGMNITAPEASIAGPGWVNLDTPKLSASAILRFSSYPPAAQRIVNTYLVVGGSTAPHIDLLADGRVRLQDASHSTIYTSASPIPLDVPVEYQLYCKTGTTLTDGTLRMRLIRRDDDTVIWDPGELTNVNASTSNYDGVRFGLPSASVWTNSVTIFGDDVAYSTDSTGLVGAYSSVDAPTGDAGIDQPYTEPWSTVTLAGTGIGNWTQVSGTTVILSGSGSTRTFTAPPSLNGDTLVFEYGGDQITITVLPATEAVYYGGQWVPVRFIRKN